MHMTPGNMQKRSSWLCPFGKAHCRTLNWWKYTIEMLKAHWAGQSSCHMNFDKKFYISLRLYQQKNYMMVVMKIDLCLIISHDRIATSSSVRDPCHVRSAQRRRILDVHLDITWVLHSKNSMRQKHDVISDDKVGYDNIEFAHQRNNWPPPSSRRSHWIRIRVPHFLRCQGVICFIHLMGCVYILQNKIIYHTKIYVSWQWYL